MCARLSMVTPCHICPLEAECPEPQPGEPGPLPAMTPVFSALPSLILGAPMCGKASMGPLRSGEPSASRNWQSESLPRGRGWWGAAGKRGWVVAVPSTPLSLGCKCGHPFPSAGYRGLLLNPTLLTRKAHDDNTLVCNTGLFP